MYCRKCGCQIPDDSVFCLKCGEKVTETEIESIRDTDELLKDVQKYIQDTPREANKSEHSNISPENKKQNKGNSRYVAVTVGVLIIFLILFFVVNGLRKCTSSGCDNLKIENSKYCRDHTCPYDNCNYYKSKNDAYCYFHEQELCCSKDDCTKLKVDGGDYCSTHTCKDENCVKERYLDTEYCLAHQINMRDRLSSPSFGFRLNSAGGIKFYFGAYNHSGKTIKYVRFKAELFNAVGDRAYEEIKHTSSVDVEIIGPFDAGEKIILDDTIIGYCDNCAKIQIRNITLVYTDGTSETGSFDYYCTK